MKFADFIDLDRQLQLGGDEGGRPLHQRLERDRRVGRELRASSGASRDGDEALLLGWAKSVSPEANGSLGRMLASAIRWTAAFLVAFGVLAGAGAAAALLHYDGTQPINILFFLGAIVGVQLLLLPVLVLTFLFRRRLGRGGRLARGLVGGMLAQVMVWLARLGLSPERAAKMRADLGSLRATNSLFARVQPLLAVTLLQVFGVAFNVAVAGVLFFLVIFSDLTFSWGTTLQTDPERVYQITSALSTPWAGVWPGARPSLELVEATRFVRMDAAFMGDDRVTALQAGGWWPFLLASTVTYGLLPRVLALVFGLYLVRSEMRRSVARNADVLALKERLRTPLVRIGPDSVVEAPKESVCMKPEADAGKEGTEGAKTVAEGLDLAVIFWAYDEEPPQETVARTLEEGLGGKLTRHFRAGGIDTPEGPVLERVQEARNEGGVDGAAVFFEPFEPPKTDARRFLARLREVLGDSMPIVVVLAEFSGDEIRPVDEGDWKAWSQAVRAAGDPFLLMHERAVAQ